MNGDGDAIDLLEFGERAGIPVALLARATEEARNAICITDAQLDLPGPRIVYVNPAFTRITGYEYGEVIGRDPRILQGPGSDRAVLDRLRADLEAGRPFEGETTNYRKDGTPFRMAWRIAPVHDEDGVVTHYVAAQDDVTVLREAEHLLRDDTDLLHHDSDWLSALVTLSVTLSRTSSPAAVLSHVIEAAVGPLGADGAAIVVVDDEHHDWVLARSAGIDTAVLGARFEPTPDSLIADTLTRGRPMFLMSSPKRVGAGLGVIGGAVAVLPVGSGSIEPYGVLVLTWNEREPFRPTERTHLGLLAQLTTLTHRKTRALDDQRSLATTLQRSLLPTLRGDSDFEVASRYRPAEDAAVVGGDWFDVVCLDDNRMAVFVGDVVGHGFTAAALMGEIRYTVRGLVRAFTKPGQLLDELDAALLASHPPGEALATMLAVIIGTDGSMDYCSAGHPHPVIRRCDGTTEVLEGAQCPLVGAADLGRVRATAHAQLHPGDSLVAFSDGVFEHRNWDYDEAYGALVGRLGLTDGSPGTLCDAALHPDGRHLNGPLRDDMVVLAIRRPAEAASRAAQQG